MWMRDLVLNFIEGGGAGLYVTQKVQGWHDGVYVGSIEVLGCFTTVRGNIFHEPAIALSIFIPTAPLHSTFCKPREEQLHSFDGVKILPFILCTI